MKNKPLSLLLLLVVFFMNWAIAQEYEQPDLEFVCELKVTTSDSFVVGNTPYGERRIIPITGGTFKGPKLQGTVLAGGADYQFVNAEDTRTEIEAIYSIKTDDGIFIHIRNEGVVYKDPAVAEQLKNGETIDWNRIYFRAAPKFNAPIDSPYNWMNNAIFVCKGVPTKEYVSIQVWKVL
ncbi:DUF3237 domain-containing protein [uncultured Maribacter sp.]|uniref:DUF3237 domain-containing protein n=1 Tax=uncultured Maribacter sp. TaxID=431308 RepID=UPI0030DA21E3|tara:strand:+ start:9256 stop:9792 length:537 start_codon:yes stop_codon:yes gene_type:complete